MVREKADRLLNDVLDAATLGTYESGAGAIEAAEDEDAEDAAPRRTRGNGGRSRTRTTATSEAGV